MSRTKVSGGRGQIISDLEIISGYCGSTVGVVVGVGETALK